MEKKVLDLILVPCGILVLVAYHLWLIHRIAKHPTKTVIGVNAINRRFWVQAMMEDVSKNGILAVQSLRNTIMASTLLASTAITLDSLVAVLMSRVDREKAALSVVYGDNSFICRFSSECSVRKILQPCKHTHKRSFQEILSESEASDADSGVYCNDSQQRKLLLVSWIACLLLLLSSVLMAVWSYSHVLVLPLACCNTLFSGLYFRMWERWGC